MSVGGLCAAVGLSRAGYYRRRKQAEQARKREVELRDQVQRVALARPAYGYRRITAELREVATSLLIERGAPVPRALFAAALLTALEEWLDRHAIEGFAPLRAAWREMSDTLGREVRVRTGQGELVGLAEDVDEAGALLVRTEARLERVVAGDVEMLRGR